jgi:hypothetical protein
MGEQEEFHDPATIGGSVQQFPVRTMAAARIPFHRVRCETDYFATDRLYFESGQGVLMIHSCIAPTTHTLAMTQLADLNRAITTSSHPPTANDLGLSAASVVSDSAIATLPAAAVLTRLCGEGPPIWPYVHGHFQVATDEMIVELHTDALRELGHRLGLRQSWGM